MTYSIQEVYQVADADERQNPSVNLADDTPLHGFVVQVWNVCGADSQVGFHGVMIGLFGFGGCHVGPRLHVIECRNEFRGTESG